MVQNWDRVYFTDLVPVRIFLKNITSGHPDVIQRFQTILIDFNRIANEDFSNRKHIKGGIKHSLKAGKGYTMALDTASIFICSADAFLNNSYCISCNSLLHWYESFHSFLTRSYLMNKSDLIDAISLKENLTDKNASEIVNLIFDGFTGALKNGGRIEIRGFGSFYREELWRLHRKESERPGLRQRWERSDCPFSKLGRN